MLQWIREGQVGQLYTKFDTKRKSEAELRQLASTKSKEGATGLMVIAARYYDAGSNIERMLASYKVIGRLLVQHGADINAQDTLGRTAMATAAAGQARAVVP
jgi:hypothetical protein